MSVAAVGLGDGPENVTASRLPRFEQTKHTRRLIDNVWSAKCWGVPHGKWHERYATVLQLCARRDEQKGWEGFSVSESVLKKVVEAELDKYERRTATQAASADPAYDRELDDLRAWAQVKAQKAQVRLESRRRCLFIPV